MKFLGNKRGEIVTTLTLLSLGFMLFGTILGAQRSVQTTVFKLFGSASTNQVLLYNNTLSEQRRSGYSLISGTICFNGLTVPSQTGRFWIHTPASQPYGASTVQYIAAQVSRPYCDGNGVLTGTPKGTPWAFTLKITDSAKADFCNGSLYFSSTHMGGPILVDTFGREKDTQICNDNTPTSNPTNNPNPTNGPACHFNVYNYVKDENGHILTDINKDNVKWYAMNDKQKAKNQTYCDTLTNPHSNCSSWYGFTNGKFIVNQDISFPLPNNETDPRYQYKSDAENACVTLYYDSDNYDLLRQEPGPGRRGSSDREICGLPLKCGSNYNYGWVLKKKDGGGGSCAINKDTCKVSGLTADIRPGDKRAHITWRNPNCSEVSLGTTQYWIDIVNSKNKIVCGQSTISSSTDTEKDCVLGIDQQRKNPALWEDLPKFADGETYTANMYTTNGGSACIVGPASVSFSKNGGQPTGGPDKQESYQLNIVQTGKNFAPIQDGGGGTNTLDPCFVAADTTVGSKIPSSTSHPQCTPISSFVRNGSTVAKMDVYFKNILSSAQLRLQWNINRCKNKLLKDTLNQECADLVATGIEKPIDPGNTMHCTWNDPASENTVTPPDCELIRGGVTPGPNPTTGPAPTAVPSVSLGKITAHWDKNAAGDGSSRDIWNLKVGICEKGDQTSLSQLTKKDASGNTTAGANCKWFPTNRTSPPIHVQGYIFAGEPVGDANLVGSISRDANDQPLDAKKQYFISCQFYDVLSFGPDVWYRCVPKPVSPNISVVLFENILRSDTVYQIPEQVALSEGGIQPPPKQPGQASIKAQFPADSGINAVERGVIGLKPGICPASESNDTFGASCTFFQSIGDMVAPNIFSGIHDSKQFEFTVDNTGAPLKDGTSYKVTCQFILDRAPGERNKVKRCNIVNMPATVDGPQLFPWANIVDDADSFSLPEAGGGSTLAFNINLTNASDKSIKEIQLKVCDKTGEKCETLTEAINGQPGADLAINKAVNTVSGTSIEPDQQYVWSCALTFSDGSKADCKNKSTTRGVPVFYKLNISKTGEVNSTVITAVERCDNNKDGVCNTIDYSRCITQYGQEGENLSCDVTDDKKIKADDISFILSYLGIAAVK